MTQKTTPWRFTTAREDIIITTAGAASLTAFAAGASFFFSPLALAAAGAYTAYKLLPTVVIAPLIPAFKRWTIKNSLKPGKGYSKPAPELPLVGLVNDFSQKLSRKELPTILMVDQKVVAKMTLPLPLRWMMKIRDIRSSIMSKVFAAVPSSNIVIATNESLNSIKGEQLKFVTAHEMAHIQKDLFSLPVYAKGIVKHATRALAVLTVGSLAAGIAGLATPAILTASTLITLGALVAVPLGANIINNFGMRTLERRADRNALYLTGDLNSAESALEILHEKSNHSAKRSSYVVELFSTHPTQARRIESLRASFAKVSAHPGYQPLPVSQTPAAEQDKEMSRWSDLSSIKR